MKHGSTIGKLADSPIAPQELRGIPAGFSGTLEEKTKRPTTGILPHPSSPEGLRRAAAVPNKVETTYREPTGDAAMDAMADELDRELNKDRA